MRSPRLPLWIALPSLLACTPTTAPVPDPPPSAPHASAGEHAHWSYIGEEGPGHWAQLDPSYTECAGGNQQSPIDINPAQVAEKPGQVNFNYHPIPLKILNNGHTIQIDGDHENRLEIDGQGYELVQVHFHAPSEHLYKGEHFAMEAHLVHKDAEGRLAVVGVFLQEGGDNETLKPAWEHLPREAGEEDHFEMVQFDLPHLVPEQHSFFHYAGSLTTPPCTEGVSWFVMEEPQSVSRAQIDAFLDIIHTNARPRQELHERPVEHGG